MDSKESLIVVAYQKLQARAEKAKLKLDVSVDGFTFENRTYTSLAAVDLTLIGFELCLNKLMTALEPDDEEKPKKPKRSKTKQTLRTVE